MTYPDVSIITLNGKTPRIHESAFIAPGCRIIGDVEIGPDVSIWYNCVLRGDVNRIRIGARTNVQDGSVIHVDSAWPEKPDGFPTVIGEDVLIGHLAMVHGCV
ncbi:MAG: gamma carbonic anhydrase family protein, partial [Novosphingobium sp. 16-62-11]